MTVKAVEPLVSHHHQHYVRSFQSLPPYPALVIWCPPLNSAVFPLWYRISGRSGWTWKLTVSPGLGTARFMYLYACLEEGSKKRGRLYQDGGATREVLLSSVKDR